MPRSAKAKRLQSSQKARAALAPARVPPAMPEDLEGMSSRLALLIRATDYLKYSLIDLQSFIRATALPPGPAQQTQTSVASSKPQSVDYLPHGGKSTQASPASDSKESHVPKLKLVRAPTMANAGPGAPNLSLFGADGKANASPTERIVVRPDGSSVTLIFRDGVWVAKAPHTTSPSGAPAFAGPPASPIVTGFEMSAVSADRFKRLRALGS